LKRRKTEIHIETREVLILRRIANASIWCDECGRQVKAIKPEEAATALGLNLRALFRQVEASRLHGCESSAGKLFICGNSLQTEIREGDYSNKNQ